MTKEVPTNSDLDRGGTGGDTLGPKPLKHNKVKSGKNEVGKEETKKSRKQSSKHHHASNATIKL